MKLQTSQVVLGAVLVGSLSGCGFFRRLGGNDTVNLEKADVQEMSVDLRRQQKTICPRESVQMAVFAKVSLDGDKTAKQFETWQGQGDVNKNDKLDFVDFAFHSEQGAFNQEGWFQPNPNLALTAGKEFQIKSVFKRRPDKFTFTTTYKPDYTCIKSGGRSGSGGGAGASGQEGRGGEAGQQGSTSQAGAAGGDGGNGAPGGPGSDGAGGPHIVAYATMVKTPFYDKLIAIAIEGDVQDFLLVPDGQPITLKASGGAGGSGGHGGHGGHGGQGGGGNPGGQGGRGGPGGIGGNGGNGGPGGQIELVYDARYPALASQLKLDVSGGPAGPGGMGGAGGDAGSGGNGMTPSGSSGHSPPPAQSGARGSAGQQGSGGSAGHPGSEGRAGARAGDVRDKFSNLGEVALLDAPSGGAPSTDVPLENTSATDQTDKKGDKKGDKKKGDKKKGGQNAQPKSKQ